MQNQPVYMDCRLHWRGRVTLSVACSSSVQSSIKSRLVLKLQEAQLQSQMRLKQALSSAARRLRSGKCSCKQAAVARTLNVLPALCGANKILFPRGAPMQHLAPRRNLEG